MSFMFELYYKPPTDSKREAALSEKVSQLGGQLTYREDTSATGIGGICLTYEFNDFDRARQAADTLRQQGEHIEGPMDYGV